MSIGGNKRVGNEYIIFFADSVLLKNTITISPDKDRVFNLSWIAEDSVDSNNINISIL